MTDMTEIKRLITEQGTAFEEFKSEIDGIKAKLAEDPITAEKIGKIEKSIDDAVEAKAALESAIAAERKEREDLELRLQRNGIKGSGENAKRELELKEFNQILETRAAERKERFEPVDEKGMDEFKAALDRYTRKGIDALSAEERKTLSVGTDADGGYFVTPDTAGRMVKKVYETSPIRQIANVQPISSDKLEGIEDLDEAGAGYAGERTTSGNTDTPGVGKWSIEAFWIDTEPKITQQLLDDSSVDIEAWVGNKVGARFGRFEGSEFVNGNTGRIRGFASYDTLADDGSGVAWGKIGHVLSGASGDFAGSNPADKLYDLVGLPKAEYLNNARFVTKRTVITKVRKLKGGDGHYLWQPALALGQPETILGYPITRAEDVPTLGAGSLSMFFGDFEQGYQIVDRLGTRILRDALTAKPFVKLYFAKRVGGGVINFEAIKAMKFAAA